MPSNIEKDLYDITKSYSQVVFSKKRPPLDYEINEAQKILEGFRKQVTQSTSLDVPVGDGFLVETTGNPNEIRVRHGLLFHKGENINLPVDSVISSLTTPSGGDRTDVVYLEWYYREVDSVEDPNLIDITNIGIETAVRTKIQLDIFVIQGGPIPVPAPNRYQYKIATLNRLDTVATLTAGQIEDTRILSGLNFVSTGGRVFQTGAFSYSFEGATGIVSGGAFGLPNSVGSVGPVEVKYLYVSDTETLVLAAGLPTSYHVPLARIQSNGSNITEIRDLRRFTPSIAGGSAGNTIVELTTLDTVSPYQVVKVSGANTTVLADASSIATMPAFGLSLDSGNINDVIRVLTSGIVTNPSWAFTPGEIYVDTTTGEITDTPPSVLSEVIQKLGVALDPTTILFSPDFTYDIVGGVALHAQNTDLGTTAAEFITRYGSGVAIATPSGFTVNRGVGLPVKVRYNPTGNKWEATDDGTAYYDLDWATFLATIAGAGAIGVDTTNFANNLSFADDTLQKALDTLDDMISGGGGGGDENKTYYRTLNSTDVNTNLYFDLPFIPSDPANVRVSIIGGSAQRYLVDYDVITDGSDIKRVNWNALRMVDTVDVGTEVLVEYAIASAATTFRFRVDSFTLDAGQILAKQVTLSQTPNSAVQTILDLKGGVPQFYADDYTVSGAILSWASLGLESLVSIGSKIRVYYEFAI